MLTPVQVETAVAAKGTRFATVHFIKKDGSPRALNGLFRPVSHILGTGRPTQPHLVAIWSPREGWRSFRKDSVLAIK
jgi:hypothetical protein